MYNVDTYLLAQLVQQKIKSLASGKPISVAEAARRISQDYTVVSAPSLGEFLRKHDDSFTITSVEAYARFAGVKFSTLFFPDGEGTRPQEGDEMLNYDHFFFKLTERRIECDRRFTEAAKVAGTLSGTISNLIQRRHKTFSLHTFLCCLRFIGEENIEQFFYNAADFEPGTVPMAPAQRPPQNEPEPATCVPTPTEGVGEPGVGYPQQTASPIPFEGVGEPERNVDRFIREQSQALKPRLAHLPGSITELRLVLIKRLQAVADQDTTTCIASAYGYVDFNGQSLVKVRGQIRDLATDKSLVDISREGVNIAIALAQFDLAVTEVFFSETPDISL